MQDRQGTVKQIYKGVVFLYDQSEQENNGYLCVKGQMCERITSSGGILNEKVCTFLFFELIIFVYAVHICSLNFLCIFYLTREVSLVPQVLQISHHPLNPLFRLRNLGE